MHSVPLGNVFAFNSQIFKNVEFCMFLYYKLVPNDLQIGAQCCFRTFVTRLLRSKYLVKAVFSFHFTSLLHFQSIPQV